MKRCMPLIFALALVFSAGSMVPDALAQDGRNQEDKWEISFLFGHLNGSAIDNPDMTCTALTTEGCNPFEDFGHNGIGGFPGKIALDATSLLQTGFLVPEGGPAWGLRISRDLNPHWQIELSVLFGTAESSLSNAEVIGSVETSFATGFSNNKAFAVLDRAEPEGNQQFYLVNANYLFNDSGKVVPYVGVGIGMAKFYNHPDVSLFVQTDGSVGFSQILIEKSTGDDETVALDVVLGVKIHATPNFGIRMEVMNIVSFPEFTHDFRVIDVNDNFGGGVGSVLEPSGSLTQENTYNHFYLGIGTFWRF